MPICFQLENKISGEVETLQKIDDRVWREFAGKEPSKSHWFLNWKNTIGFLLACGKSFEEIKEGCEDETQWNLLTWLEERYKPVCWYSPK